MPDLTETIDIEASADKLYAMVSDLPRMGEWSPENLGARWTGATKGPRLGAKFIGKNQVKRLVWWTQGRVVAADPGRQFSFETRLGPVQSALWDYRFEPTASGVRVVESWTDRRPRWGIALADRIFGVPRTTLNQKGMRKTLAELKKAAEAGS